ncbi:helix-turn-helix transcriptional regulator [Clostridium intestinale]|uniref:helix-turn-helix transcriptional regulator n=1 Tax=Clostridium intestinale TaxID=36845 RepID=UPI0028E68C73|nr:helix-turn-helix transcriptional regulator [Clostridium intestinale]
MKNKLEELRKEKGLSQDQFGRLMKVSRQTIISLEKGKYNPSLDLAFRIAEFFNLRIEEIFMYKGDENE